MNEFLGSMAVLVARTMLVVIDIAAISDMFRFARWATESGEIVEVPADPKILPPAAQRALVEATQRRRQAYAASGTVQASWP